MAAADFNEDAEKFEWTPTLKTILLDSLLHENLDTEKHYLVCPNGSSMFQPLKLFACYVQFCKKAFRGPPPEKCTLEEFEYMLKKLSPSHDFANNQLDA